MEAYLLLLTFLNRSTVLGHRIDVGLKMSESNAENCRSVIACRSETSQIQSFTLMIQDNSPALAPQRRERQRQMLREGVARVEELLDPWRFPWPQSEAGSEILEEEDKIRRVHGGSSIDEQIGRTYVEKQKERIYPPKTNRPLRRRRASPVEPEEAIYLNGGSTLFLARLLRERTDLTVVTNSLQAAIELADYGPQNILIGRELRRISQTMVGPYFRRSGTVHVDKAFMGTMGFCLKNGLTTTDPNEALFQYEIVARSELGRSFYWPIPASRKSMLRSVL